VKRDAADTLNRSIQLRLQTASKLVGKAVALMLFGMVSASAVHAATVSFTFAITGGSALTGPPSPATPTVGVMLFASGAFAPFGSGSYTEEGSITFTMYPSGAFAPSLVTNSFTASFAGGADTIIGTDVFLFGPPTAVGQTITNAMTILGGTGVFSGASGFATGTGFNTPPPGPGELSPVFFSGSGQITAARLEPIPEPMTIVLFATGVAGIALLHKFRTIVGRRRARSTR
jgi:hypothetical protein